jgi:hypothetical protein
LGFKVRERDDEGVSRRTEPTRFRQAGKPGSNISGRVDLFLVWPPEHFLVLLGPWREDVVLFDFPKNLIRRDEAACTNQIFHFFPDARKDLSREVLLQSNDRTGVDTV